MMLYLKDFDYVNENSLALCQEFLSLNSKNRFVLGRNKWANSIIENVHLSGVIDDFFEEEEYKKLKVFKVEEVPNNAIVVFATMGVPQTIKQKLDILGIRNIDYFSFFKYSGLKLEAPPFSNDFKDDFLKNRNKFENLYNLLADEKSRKIFEKIINFKITFDISFMKEFKNDIDLQYFEDDFFEVPKEQVFIDGGGFKGDTSLILLNKYPDTKKIYLFEPLNTNFELAKKELKNYQNIEFIEAGLSNFQGETFFTEDEASSSIDKYGTLNVRINYIDNIIYEKVDFIKLDIEGSEQEALDGAKNTIKKYKPILAVCIYHKSEDWYKIPEKILSLFSGYKIFLRHYMEGIFETVMYFIPPNRLRDKNV